MANTITAAKAAPLLLEWYDRHHRERPWRVSPSMARQGVVANPYHIWMSEVMLQQTTVQAVKAYFEKFLTLWPAVENLAAADNEDVGRRWRNAAGYHRGGAASGQSGQAPAGPTGLIEMPALGGGWFRF